VYIWGTDRLQELSVWRKQANLSVQEEFAGKTLPPDLEDSLPKTLPELFDTVRSGVRRSSESYINLCNMMERLTRRNEGMAAEYHRFSTALVSLTESSQETYAVDTNDVPLLNEGMNSTARHLDQSKQLLEDEARGWEEGVLEDFKRQRDTLVSMRDMFDRRDKYARDNIPALEKRIANNETKLQNIRNKPADLIKPGEAEKVEDAISKVIPKHTSQLIRWLANLMIDRTRNPSSSSMRGVSSSRSASEMNCYISKRVNTTLADCIRNGVKSV
jgi:sorting nexin-8